MPVSLGEVDPRRELINPFTAMQQAPLREAMAPPAVATPSAAAPTGASAAPVPATVHDLHLLRALHRLADTLYEWHERSQQRHFLSGMDEALLRDIGRSRADAEAEASKPFWRP